MLKYNLFSPNYLAVVLFLDKMGFWKHSRSFLGVSEWPQPPILEVPLHFRKIITQIDVLEQEN